MCQAPPRSMLLSARTCLWLSWVGSRDGASWLTLTQPSRPYQCRRRRRAGHRARLGWGRTRGRLCCELVACLEQCSAVCISPLQLSSIAGRGCRRSAREINAAAWADHHVAWRGTVSAVGRPALPAADVERHQLAPRLQGEREPSKYGSEKLCLQRSLLALPMKSRARVERSRGGGGRATMPGISLSECG
jgi:hypothetical protein